MNAIVKFIIPFQSISFYKKSFIGLESSSSENLIVMPSMYPFFGLHCSIKVLQDFVYPYQALHRNSPGWVEIIFICIVNDSNQPFSSDRTV